MLKSSAAHEAGRSCGVSLQAGGRPRRTAGAGRDNPNRPEPSALDHDDFRTFSPRPLRRAGWPVSTGDQNWDGSGEVRRARSVLALAALVLVAAGCGAVHHMGPHAGNPVAGKALFLSTCSSCHTLAAAGTSGKIGPNYDLRVWTLTAARDSAQSTIQDVVRGQIAYADSNPEADFPPNSSNAVVGMPAGLLNGQKAKDVAAYVSSVAGITHGPGKHWDCQTGSYTLPGQTGRGARRPWSPRPDRAAARETRAQLPSSSPATTVEPCIGCASASDATRDRRLRVLQCERRMFNDAEEAARAASQPGSASQRVRFSAGSATRQASATRRSAATQAGG